MSFEEVLMNNNQIKTSYPKKAKPLNQHEILKKNLKNLFTNWWSNELDNDLPKKWKIAQDLLILPSNCFLNLEWNKIEQNLLWKTVADSFKLNRIAKENKVKPDDYRSPNLTLLYGQNSNVVVNNNGIKYSYDIEKCMFSWGNITEKLRIADFDCSNETVVDLFAGIGYFSLVYLVHAKAKHLIACEWNPASVEALKNNLKLNECSNRCTVLEGDNRETCPKNCADRVNLGLIPSSEMSWETACKALKKDKGGFLHIHGNVDIKENSKEKSLKKEWIEWSNYTLDKLKNILNKLYENENLKWSVKLDHTEYVKSYGPRVDHLVLDLECRPII